MKKLIILKFWAFVTASVLLSSCQPQQMVDPFWNVQLNTNKTTLLNTLESLVQNRELENCVFSFRKESYIRDGLLDVRLIGNLDMPLFHNQRVEALSYSLLVQSKEQEAYTFNRQFFDYFKGAMISSYGDNLHEKQFNDRIQLSWETSSGDSVKVVVLKEINRYLVDIKL